MKAKLLKKLRRKYYGFFYISDYPTIPQVFQRYSFMIKEDIQKNRLWYKLLTTITHKKDV